MFKRPQSLAELQEEDERLDTELSVAQKKAVIKQLDDKMGKGSWKIFSDNGKMSGLNWHRVLNWLKSN